MSPSHRNSHPCCYGRSSQSTLRSSQYTVFLLIIFGYYTVMFAFIFNRRTHYDKIYNYKEFQSTVAAVYFQSTVAAVYFQSTVAAVCFQSTVAAVCFQSTVAAVCFQSTVAAVYFQSTVATRIFNLPSQLF